MNETRTCLERHLRAMRFFSNKRSFKGSGGVVRRIDSVGWAKICVRELASWVSCTLQGASRGLPWPPDKDGTDNIMGEPNRGTLSEYGKARRGINKYFPKRTFELV